MNFKKGFTLIELLVVVAIIGLLASVVLAVLSGAKSKGADAGVKSNLRNAISQAEIFYNTNTIVPNSYTSVCTNPGPVGGANTVAAHMIAAAKVAGLASPYFTSNVVGSAVIATCNDSAGAWAAQVPLSGSTVASPKMWCVDSSGKSKQETVSSLTTTTTYTCI